MVHWLQQVAPPDGLPDPFTGERVPVTPLFIAHNGFGFDYRVLFNALREAGMPMPQARLFDTLLLAELSQDSYLLRTYELDKYVSLFFLQATLSSFARQALPMLATT